MNSYEAEERRLVVVHLAFLIPIAGIFGALHNVLARTACWLIYALMMMALIASYLLRHAALRKRHFPG